MNKSRDGFTLIELLVVMALIALLAGLTVAFLPGTVDQQRAARGATMLQGWLNAARQRAFQRRTIVGLRLINAGGFVKECQYIEKPDDFTDKTGTPSFLFAGAFFNTSTNQFELCGNAWQMNVRGLGPVDLLNGYGVAPPNQLAPELPFWTVQPGDNLEILGGGLVHRIRVPDINNNIPPGVTNVLNPAPPTLVPLFSTILLESTPDPFVPFYRVQVQGNPVAGSTFKLQIAVNALSPPGPVAVTTVAIAYDANAQTVQTAITDKLGPLFYPNVFPANRPPTASVTQQGGSSWQIVFFIPTFVSNIQVAADASNISYPSPPPPSPTPPYVTVTGPTLQDFGVNQPIPYFRILRAPRLSGEEQLQLPNNIVVDLSTNQNYANNAPLPLGPGGELDILFSPSGAVITPGLKDDFLALWVRDTTGNTVFEIGPTILAVHLRTGLVAAHPPNDSGADPYSFARDGRAQ